MIIRTWHDMLAAALGLPREVFIVQVTKSLGLIQPVTIVVAPRRDA